MPAKSGPARTRTTSPSRAGREALDAAPTSDELQKMEAEIVSVHGQGVVVRGDKMPRANHSPCGAFALDLGLCGGFAEGYAGMIYGFESSGKTLVALLAIAGFQKKHPNKLAVFVDAEKLYDPEWAKRLGVDTRRLRVITPDTGEQAVDTLAAMMAVDVVGFAVVDSVPTCVPKAVMDRSAEDKTMGALAALMGVMCSKIITSWGRERRRGHYVTVLLLNQWRMKVGFVLGDPRTLPGGRQINHLPTTKIAMKGKEEEGKDEEGDKVRTGTELFFKFEKTKHGKSINEGAFTVVLADGHESGLPPGTVDDSATVAVYCFKFGLATGSGGRYRLADFTEDTFRKKEDIAKWLRDNPYEQKLVRATIIAAMRMRHSLEPLPPDNSLEGLHEVHKLIDMALVRKIANKHKAAETAASAIAEHDEEEETNEEEA
jgi:recombination protein RecA